MDSCLRGNDEGTQGVTQAIINASTTNLQTLTPALSLKIKGEGLQRIAKKHTKELDL
jgi:hypothetical protein